jgi:hypothetical protein
MFHFHIYLYGLSQSPVILKKLNQRDFRNRTKQNRNCIGLKSIYKGLLPKQHIKYKTKKLLTTIKLHIYMFETHDSLMTFSMRRLYILNMI